MTNGQNITTMYIDTQTLITAGDLVPRWFDGAREPITSLSQLVAVAGRHAAQDAIVVVGAELGTKIGVSAKPPAAGGKGWPRRLHLAPVVEGGWVTPADAHPCTMWYQPGDDTTPQRNLYVWLQQWTDDRMIIDPLGDGWETVCKLLRYRELTGGPYIMTPGASGINLLQHYYQPRRAPFWKPSWDRMGPDHAVERAWSPRWYREANAAPGMHGWEYRYDGRAAYLAAIGTVEVAAGRLYEIHGDAIAFDPKMAGWWLVRRQPWALPLPDPIGPGYDHKPYDPDRPQWCWVTTPTAKLLCDLSDAGLYGGLDISSAWLDRANRTVFRPLGEALNRARTVCMGRDDPDDRWPDHGRRGPVAQAIHDTYSHMVGMMVRPTSRVHRPDWAAAIIAQARTTLFRKLLGVYQTCGLSPYEIRTDGVTYFDPRPPEYNDTGELVYPTHLHIGRGLGQFRFDGATERAAIPQLVATEGN